MKRTLILTTLILLGAMARAQVSGGVSKITAGTNVTISPSGGTGNVTINASGGGGGGTIGGTVDMGYMPIATAPNTLGNGPIEDGLSEPGYLTIKPLAGDTNGLLITTALVASAPADTSLELLGGAGVTIENNPSVNLSSSLVIFNGDTGGTQIQDGGGGGIELSATNGANFIALENSGSGGTSITDTGGGGILIDSVGGAALSPGNVVIGGLLVPGIIYSAAGIALPACGSGINGAQATVSDSTTQVWGAAYVSGGMLPAALYCDGTLWSIYAK